MKRIELAGATALALLFAASPAFAQTTPQAEDVPADTGEIIVTAQRQSESLQDVPIAVSAFSGEQLKTRQINNALDLQLSLPNVTFTKTNFTSSSLTIRGVGDLCVGTSCDQATGIHVNDMPSITRLFETEYFDLERVEVLRGPQGTLFGRNATSGVVNFITKRPDLTKFGASGELEYGNYDSIKAKATINVPLGDTLGVRLAGFYLKRDGYTHDLANGKDIDDRDMYAVRGTIRFQPSESTTLDIIGYYFREKDHRNRVGKQLCHRDTSGVLGCAPDRVGFDITNGHATLGGILTNSEVIGPLGWTSRAGPDIYAGQINPTDLRTVNSGYTPFYFVEDKQIQARLEQELGDKFGLTVTGGWTSSDNDSRTDYNMAAPRNVSTYTGIPTFKALFPTAAGLLFSGNDICVSDTNDSYGGIYAGQRQRCAAAPTTADRSTVHSQAYSIEGHIDSKFDGAFNFLLGGIYYKLKADTDYFVTGSTLDYAAVALAGVAGGQLGYIGPSMFNSETDPFHLKSYGIFGEAYFEPSDKFKITLGARYSNDKKSVSDRQFLYNFFVPFNTTNALSAAGFAGYDADVNTPGPQPFRNLNANFDEITGRVVFDWKVTDDNLLYLSLSRGYKSGGINPPFDNTLFQAPATFEPEIIKAIEIGTKNKFADGKLIVNASAFYYDYKAMQLSRIINRTSFNDNTDAEVYGVEIESILRPDPAWMFNLSASYLHTKIKNFSLVDTRDPSGGRADTVIIKDAASASNCVVTPTGNIPAQALFAAVPALGTLVPVTGTNTVGAFSSCSAILGIIAAPPAALAAGFGVAPGSPLPFAFNRNLAGAPLSLPSGVPYDLSGNKLPQAPTWKFSAGAQYTKDFANGMSLVTRLDLTYTGEYFSRSFNRPIDRIKGYEIVNASMQLNGAEDRWFVRGFVQNLTANNAITGQYVTDPSSGLFTNVFVMEPRRYGLSVGFNF